MSNASTVAVAAAMIAGLKPANFGPKRLLGQPDDVREFLCGTLVGIASKFVMRAAPDGTEFIGYGGQFEYTDSDPSVGSLKSGVLFLPSGIDDAMKEVCEAAFKERGATVRLAFEVYTMRTSAPAGYGWKLIPLVETSQVDPLAELKALMADRSGRALAGPSAAKALEGPKEIEGEAEKAPAGKGK